MEEEKTKPEEWVEMRIRGVLVDPSSDVPVVLLRDDAQGVFLPIWIGAFEASAIAMAIEGIEVRRPMTHDLLRMSIESLGATLVRLEIWKLEEGTFFGRLRMTTASGEILIDSRPSDGLALALRCKAPVWVAKDVLQGALQLDLAIEKRDEEKLRQWLENARPEDLPKYEM
ncbi:MAG: bifunctional nuclease family protein [Thermoanaerobaculia bacterium]